MKKKLPTIMLILVLLVGLSLLLYPTVSDYWNSLHQSRAIASYAEAVSGLSDEDYEAMLADAQAYNASLRERPGRFELTEEETAAYNALLDVSGTGIMGYISIPKINCSLPIYHGADESVLQVAIGHVAGSSLPVGGSGTHCVVSGHRGLPSAKLFTDLDQMVEGDSFTLRVLDETLTYEVDQILTVLPHEVTALALEADQDYCTLVTCTPYGINTHRLLVRGHRVENAKESASVRVTADAMQIEPVLVAPVVAAPMLLALLVVMLATTGRKKR